MHRNQFLIVLLAVVVSSFLGGMLVQLLNTNSLVVAKEPGNYFTEVRTKAVHLVGQDNKIQASFYLGLHDSPQLVLYDKEGTNRFNFGLAPAGNPGITFNNETYNKLLEFDTKNNRSSITLWDTQSKIVWQAP